MANYNYNNNNKNNRKYEQRARKEAAKYAREARRSAARKYKKGSSDSYLSRTSFANRFSGSNGRLGVFFERITPFLKLFVSLFGIFLLLIPIFGWFDNSKDTEESFKEHITEKYKVVDIFESPDPKKPKKVTLKYTIILENPYTTTEQVEYITKYLRAKYVRELTESDKKLMRIEADIHKRKTFYNRGYLPSDSYTYDLQKAKSITETLEQRKPNYKKYNDSLSFTPIERLKVDKEVDELTGEVIREGTEEPKLEGQTYAKFLVLLEYATLMDSTEKAVEFYVAYDLKLSLDSTAGKSMYKETMEYYERYRNTGEPTDLLENAESLWAYYKENYPKKYQKLRVYFLDGRLP